MNPPLHAAPPSLSASPAVGLLHGLGLGSWAMHPIAVKLRKAGYRVFNLNYDSRHTPLETLATVWLPAQLAENGISTQTPLNFVTHSMGGIVVRGWLAAQPAPPANLRRVVMLVPPHQGAALVDRIINWKLFRLFTGVNGVRLSTAADSYPRALGAWPVGPELGIIAGDHPLMPLLTAGTRHPGDGKVRVAETELEGMTDHVVLPYSHTWIQYRREPIEQVLGFLRHGRFHR